MSGGASQPLSRPLRLQRLPVELVVEANEAERAALASALRLCSVASLSGRFRVEGDLQHAHVTGRVEAEVEQICVVTLDPFPSRIVEEVDVTFQERRPVAGSGRAGEIELDPADEDTDDIVNGQIDLGALTAEFLALSLDPYPKKPGAVFETEGERPADTPFAALARLVDPEP